MNSVNSVNSVKAEEYVIIPAEMGRYVTVCMSYCPGYHLDHPEKPYSVWVSDLKPVIAWKAGGKRCVAEPISVTGWNQCGIETVVKQPESYFEGEMLGFVLYDTLTKMVLSKEIFGVEALGLEWPSDVSIRIAIRELGAKEENTDSVVEVPVLKNGKMFPNEMYTKPA